MMPIFRLFLAVCLFRKGPQDVPASGLLLGLLIGLNLLVSFLLVLGAIWPDLQPVTPWLMLGFMIWGQLILANLLKIALAWPAIAALGVAFLYLVISMDLIRYLFDR